MPCDLHKGPDRAQNGVIMIRPAIYLPPMPDERFFPFKVFVAGIVGLAGLASLIIMFGALAS